MLSLRQLRLDFCGERGGGFFLEEDRMARGAIDGSVEGTLQTCAIRRVGAQRPWDAEESCHGGRFDWTWNQAADDEPEDIDERWLTDVGKTSGHPKIPGEDEGENTHGLAFPCEDFIQHGLADGCAVCQAMLAGNPPPGTLKALLRSAWNGLYVRPTQGNSASSARPTGIIRSWRANSRRQLTGNPRHSQGS